MLVDPFIILNSMIQFFGLKPLSGKLRGTYMEAPVGLEPTTS